MFRLGMAVARKDLLLLLWRGNGLTQALLFGLLLIFIFSLSQEIGGRMPAQGAAAIFWLSSTFCQILIFNQLYALEESHLARLGLLLCATPLEGIWLGKALAGLLLLFIAQVVFLPAVLIFLDQSLGGDLWLGICALFLVDLGLCGLGSLLGALAQGQSGRESLLSVVLFPLLMPLLLGGIRLGAESLGAAQEATAAQWLGVVCAFDALFLGLGLLLFGKLYGGED